MSFNNLANEIVFILAKHLPIRDLNSLAQVNRGLEWLLIPLLYDRTVDPPDHAPRQRALSWAAARGYIRPTKLLLSRGAELTWKYWRYGETPLHLAARSGHLAIIRLFLTHSPEVSFPLINTTDHGPRPITLAAGHGHKDIVKFLINFAEKEHILCALESAATYGKADIVEMLLLRVDGTGLYEPLQRAAAYGYAHIATMLLAHMDADRRAVAATSAVAATVRAGHEDVLAVLLGAGGSGNADMGGSRHRTIMHWLSEFACWLSLVKGRRAERVAAVLLGKGADPCAVDDGGSTPLHLAARRGVHVVRRMLIQYSYMTEEEKKVRSAEAEESHRELLKLLVRGGADVNARDKLGRTPLHEAAENSDEVTVGALLDLGAETTLVDDRGQTAVDLAVEFLGRDGSAGVVCTIREYELAMSMAWEEV